MEYMIVNTVMMKVQINVHFTKENKRDHHQRHHHRLVKVTIQYNKDQSIIMMIMIDQCDCCLINVLLVN